MKYLINFIFILLLSGCSYNYSVGVSSDLNPQEYTSIRFTNKVKITKIDGVEFKRKVTPFVDDKHTVKLNPGVHSFEFKYSSKPLSGNWSYALGSTEMSHDMKAGVHYEIKYSIDGNKVSYEIAEIED